MADNILFWQKQNKTKSETGSLKNKKICPCLEVCVGSKWDLPPWIRWPRHATIPPRFPIISVERKWKDNIGRRVALLPPVPAFPLQELCEKWDAPLWVMWVQSAHIPTWLSIISGARKWKGNAGRCVNTRTTSVSMKGVKTTSISTVYCIMTQDRLGHWPNLLSKQWFIQRSTVLWFLD